MPILALLMGALGSRGTYLRGNCLYDKAKAQLEALNAPPEDPLESTNYIETVFQPFDPCYYYVHDNNELIWILLLTISVFVFTKLSYFAWFSFVTRASRT